MEETTTVPDDLSGLDEAKVAHGYCIWCLDMTPMGSAVTAFCGFQKPNDPNPDRDSNHIRCLRCTSAQDAAMRDPLRHVCALRSLPGP